MSVIQIPVFFFRQDEATTVEYLETCFTYACDIKPSRSLSAAYMFQLSLQSPYSIMEPTSIPDLPPGVPTPPRTSPSPPISRIVVLDIMADKLETMYEAGRDDVMTAASTTPFHGVLLCARYLIAGRDLQ